jgi:hypothetical protein
MTKEEEAFKEGVKDKKAQAVRVRLCAQLNEALNDYGLKIFAAGNAIGGGVAKAQDPELKDLLERMVGLSCVVQIAGELGVACVSLLETNQFYASYALVRQIVECEYLCWAFSEDQDEARKWLSATRVERLNFWSPKHMRARSHDEFRGKDYAVHCEIGGHPTPRSFILLHATRTMPINAIWLELTTHLANTWSHITRAIPDTILPLLDRKPGSQDKISEVIAAVNNWLSSDPALQAGSQLPDFPTFK